MTLRCTYTNGGTAVTNSTLKALGMWKVIIKIDGVPYHEYYPENTLRINEDRGYVPESTDCNAIGASTAGTAYAVFELPFSFVKTDKNKKISIEVTHTTTGAGSTNAGTVTNPYMDLIIYYNDAVPFTTRHVAKAIPSNTAGEDNPPVSGILDKVTIYGAADYITGILLKSNEVPVIDLTANWGSYMRERTLRLQGTRLGYGGSVDVDNVPIESTTKLTVYNSTAQAITVGYLIIAEADTAVLGSMVEKPVTIAGKSTVALVPQELTPIARVAGLYIPRYRPDSPFGEIQ